MPMKIIESLRLGANTMARAELSEGDFITVKKFSNAQQPITLSIDPTTEGTESAIYPMVATSPQKFYAQEVELSISQRVRHDLPYFDCSSLESRKPNLYPISVNLIYQSSASYSVAYNAVAGTVLQATLSRPLPDDVYLGDWVHISGLVDNRLNYPNFCIAYISIDRMTIGGTVSDETTLPSIAATYSPAANTVFINFHSDFSGCSEGGALRFSGTAATSAAVLSSYSGGVEKVAGSPVGDQRVSMASTATVSYAGGTGNIDLEPTSRIRIEYREDSMGFLGKTSNSASNYWIPYAIRNSIRANRNTRLSPRIRAASPISMTRPVAKISTISKAGTATATVIHDGSYPFQTGQYVTIKGVRDTVNFAAITVPAVITVIDQFTFQIVLGSAVTATSHGGTVVLTNGGADQPGINSGVIQSVSYDAVNNLLLVVGNATWAGFTVCDYVNIHGVRSDVDGSDLGVDGAWEVWHLSTTSMWLKPITDVTGSRISPSISSLPSTNSGGSVILRTSIRIYDFYYEELQKSLTVDGQGTARIDRALPIRMVANDVAQLTRGYVAADAVADTNVVAMGGKVANANPTPMSATGDANHVMMTMIGALIARPYSIPESEWSYTGIITTTSDTAIKAAAAAGIRNYLNGFQLQNTGASPTTLSVKDGATVIWQCSLPASMTIPIDIEFKVPLKSTTATAFNVACGTASSVTVNAQGHFAP